MGGKTGQEFTARIELLAADTGLRVPQVKVFSLYPGTKSRNDLNRKKSPFTFVFYGKLERLSLYPGTKSRNELNYKKSPFSFVFYGKLERLSLYPGTKSRNELNRRERQRRIMVMTCIIAPVPL